MTLDKAVTLAIQVEAVSEMTRSISTSILMVLLAAVHKRPPADWRWFQKLLQKATPAPAVPNSTATSKRSSYQCSANKHLTNRLKCLATAGRCQKCQKAGHVARLYS